jgi:hypothetical protein
MIKKKKRKFLNDVLLKMEDDFMDNNTKEAYKGVNFFKKGFKPNTNLCRNTSGVIISNKEEIKTRWKEYYSELLNPKSTSGQQEATHIPRKKLMTPTNLPSHQQSQR